jgi:hypothetical protein
MICQLECVVVASRIDIEEIEASLSAADEVENCLVLCL